MKKMNKKLISILLAVIMIFGTTAVGLTAFAEGDEWNCVEQGHVAVEGSLKTNSSTQHSYVCEKCGQTVYENHSFPENNPNGVCTSCGYKYDCSARGHFLGGTYASQCSDKSHTIKCIACGETWEEKHTYTALNEACDICGLVYEGCTPTTHFYEVSADKTTHSCAYCDIKNIQHTFNAFGNCVDCGFHDCTIAGGHVYRGGFEFNENEHWKVCEYCGAIDSDGSHTDTPDNTKAPHTDSNGDGQCDNCGYYCGHKWQLTGHSDPSCTGMGSNTYTCYFCGESKDEDIPPLGHYWYDDTHVSDEDREYVDFEFSPNFESCTLTFKCRRPECGFTVSYTVYTEANDVGGILANKDTKRAISKQVAPDCINGSGLRYYAFFTVSDVLREMNFDISPAIIDPEDPTNDRPGMMTISEYVAHDSDLKDLVGENGENLDPNLNANELGFICMATVPDGVKPPLGHVYNNPDYMQGGANYQSNNDASCTEDGTRTALCDRCGHLSDKVPDEGSALGHDFDYDHPTKPATCTEDGLCICSRCKDEVTLPALGHDWVEDESKYVAPTCGNEGQRVYNCSRCDETKTETIEALAHTPDPSKAVVVAPTCTEEGYTKNYCSVCQQYYNTDYTPANGHTWGEWSEKIYYGDDDTKDGYQIRVCEVCGATEQKTVPGSAPGHLYVYTDIGDEDHHLVICAHCGEPKDYKAHVDGNYDFICDECGHEMSFWHHWLHYLVGLPTYGFGNFFTRMMDAFTAFIRMITKDMI